MKIVLPTHVKSILRTLHQSGYEAYIVGGCVRDSLLGRQPMDWDMTTNATPKEVKQLFRRTVDTGIEHGTVTVLMDKDGYEITTYRVDGEYEDCRHPKEVLFTKELHEDLLRRDFTINAMAYNEEEGLQDLFGGMKDLEQGIIRCVGCAKERLSEDALRILRALRFSAQLGFSIEEETKDAIIQLAPHLEQISEERIQTELVKLICSKHPEQLINAYTFGVTKVFLPEFDTMMETTQESVHHQFNVGEHTIKVMEQVKEEKVLRLAALLHDVGKPMAKVMDQDGVAHFKGHAPLGAQQAKRILKRLKFDNDTIKKVVLLVEHHDDYYNEKATKEQVRRLRFAIGDGMFPAYVALKKADILGQSKYLRQEKLANLEKIQEFYRESLQEGDCVSLKNLAVTGKDIIDYGIAPGPKLGQVLNQMMEMVLKDPKANEKEALLKAIPSFQLD